MKHDNKYEELFSTEKLSDDLKKTSLRGGLHTIIGQGMTLILRIGSIAVLARILIPEHFGLISMVTAITVIAERFKDLGLSIATIQKREITHAQVSNLFWINVIIGVLIMIILCAFSKILARFYADDRLIWITVAISTSFFCGGMTIQHQAILIRKMLFAKIVYLGVVADFLSIVIAIVLAVKGFGYWALVWKEVSRSIFIAIGTWIVCPWIPGLPVRNANVGKMIRFGRDVTGFNLVTYLTHNIDQILIGKFYGTGPLGIYRQASQLALLPVNILASSVRNVAQSALSVLQNDAIRYRQYYKKVVTLIGFVSMPLAVFLFIHSRHIILLLLGEKWIKADEIFKIYSLAAFIRPVVSTTGLIMITCGNTKRYFFLGLANSMVIIIAIVIGLKWGAVGVAIGHVLANYIFFLPVLIIAFRNTPISVKLFISSTLPSVISSLLMGGILLLFSNTFPIQNSFYAITGSLPIAAAAYIVVWMLIPGGKLRIKEIITDFGVMFKKRELDKV